MITGLLMGFLLDVFGWLAAWWPAILVVGCIAATCGSAIGSTGGSGDQGQKAGVASGSSLWNAVHTVFSAASSMGAWFPWPLLLCVLAGVVAAWVNAYFLKTIRQIGSFMTGGGGSAG